MARGSKPIDYDGPAVLELDPELAGVVWVAIGVGDGGDEVGGFEVRLRVRGPLSGVAAGGCVRGPGFGSYMHERRRREGAVGGAKAFC